MATTVGSTPNSGSGKFIFKRVTDSDVINADYGHPFYNAPVTITPQSSDNFCVLRITYGKTVYATNIDGVATNYNMKEGSYVIFGNSITIKSTNNYSYTLFEYGPA